MLLSGKGSPGGAAERGGVWTWYSDLGDLDADDWLARVNRQSRPSPFLTPAFLLPWAAVFAGEVRAGLWKTDGLALFHRKDEQAWELLGGQDVADRLDVVGDDREMWSALREETARWELPVEFPNLGPDSDALQFSVEGDVPVETDRSPFLTLSGTFDDYLAGLPKKARHELKRKLNRAERLAEGGLTVEHGPGQLDEFLLLHRLSHPDKEAFMQGPMERFFRELCASLEAADMLWIATLREGGRPVAGMMQIRYAGVAHLYNSGYDPAASSLSPGLVLIARCIERAIEDGFREYDFLRGTERYKYDLGGVDRSVARLTWGAGGTAQGSGSGRAERPDLVPNSGL